MTDVAANPIETAPRDCTTLRLLVQFEEHALMDSCDPVWTIGHNNFDNDGEDTWLFAGWCWSHDHYTHGAGKVIGWLPFHAGVSTEQAEALVSTFSKAFLRAHKASPARFDFEQHEAAYDKARAALVSALTGVQPLPAPPTQEGKSQ